MKMRLTGGRPSGVVEPGDFTYVYGPTDKEPATIVFKNPKCKYGNCEIRITTGEAKHPFWHWDGNREAPTLAPSIGCDHRCGWHGSITNGELNP